MKPRLLEPADALRLDASICMKFTAGKFVDISLVSCGNPSGKAMKSTKWELSGGFHRWLGMETEPIGVGMRLPQRTGDCVAPGPRFTTWRGELPGCQVAVFILIREVLDWFPLNNHFILRSNSLVMRAASSVAPKTLVPYYVGVASSASGRRPRFASISF